MCKVVCEVAMTVTDIMKLTVQVLIIFKGIHGKGAMHKDLQIGVYHDGVWQGQEQDASGRLQTVKGNS